MNNRKDSMEQGGCAGSLWKERMGRGKGKFSTYWASEGKGENFPVNMRGGKKCRMIKGVL